jgi:hypothetical protein
MEVQWWLIGIGAVLFFIALYLLGTSGPKDVRGRAGHIEGRYGPNLPWWLAIFRRLPIKSRIELIESIKEENKAQIEFVKTEEEIKGAELDSTFIVDRVQEARDVEIAATDNILARTNRATELYVSPEKLDEIRFVEATNESTLVLEKGKAEIETNKHREKQEIDFEIFKLEKEIEVKGAIIARIALGYEMEVLTECFNRTVDKRKMLLLEPDDDSRRKKLKRLNKNIKILDKAADAKGQGLIQGDNGLQLDAMDED